MSFSQYKSTQWRAVIEFISGRVPGDALRRHLTVAEAFCPKVLGRDFDPIIDCIHIAGDFHAPHAKCWLLIDFNSQEPGLEVDGIPHSYFKTRYTDDL